MDTRVKDARADYEQRNALLRNLIGILMGKLNARRIVSHTSQADAFSREMLVDVTVEPDGRIEILRQPRLVKKAAGGLWLPPGATRDLGGAARK